MAATAIGKKKKTSKARVVVIGKPHVKRKTKRKVSGAAPAIGRSHHRRAHHKKAAVGKKKKKSSSGGGYLGATKSMPNNVMAIAKLAGGLAIGYAGAHYILKPAEAWLVQKFPWLQKILAGAEIFIGGMIALKAKNHAVKAAGIGIAASGVQGIFTQFNIFSRLPGMHGVDEYTRINVPISGSMQGMIGSLLQDGNNVVYTSQVAGGSRTAWMAGEGAAMGGGSRTAMMAGSPEYGGELEVMPYM
jgi:hypothetical protein